MPDTRKVRENPTNEEAERLLKGGSLTFKSIRCPGYAGREVHPHSYLPPFDFCKLVGLPARRVGRASAPRSGTRITPSRRGQMGRPLDNQ
jgi:hypothetical protein